QKPEYIESDYVLVWVPNRRHTESVMVRPVINKGGMGIKMEIEEQDGQKWTLRGMKRPNRARVVPGCSQNSEELLEKQLDRPRQSLGRPKRNITDPFTSASRPATTGVVFDEKAEFGINDAIERARHAFKATTLSSFHSGRRDRLNRVNTIEAASDFHGMKAKDSFTTNRHTPSPQRDEASSLPSQNGDWRNTLNPPAAPQHDKSPSPFPHSTSSDSPYGNDGKSSSIQSLYLRSQWARMCWTIQGDSDFEEPDGKQGTCVPLHERTEEEKEKMYGEIAKRLMEMGDNFVIHGCMSDSESQRDAASQLQADGGNPLEDLENEITEILREKGDEIDKKLGGAGPEVPQEVKEQIRAEMYGRFKQTVQHAIGNEVSWNHLASPVLRH
ncbi:hypothetical protein BaRGS_00032557, partial [Batillaria attramentaria]